MPYALSEGIAELLHDVFESGNFLDELRALRQQDVTYQTTEARGPLRSFRTEIRSFERRQIWHYSEVTRVLAHGVKNRAQAKDEKVAECGSDFGGLAGFQGMAALAEIEGFVQRHAQHQVCIFKFASVGVEKA